ncbi:MAG: hypothetical protein GY714_20970 [Desulfobacterales bacterium]|nr:hypothetical protein [Desulfobacterales bacterium]
MPINHSPYIEVDGVDSADNVFVSDVIGNKSDTTGGDSLVSLSKTIITYLGGTAIQLRSTQSESGRVEEDGIINFNISIIDIDAGPIVLADIDITSISAVMEKSTGGGAFSTAGITQPTFAKSDGLVSDDYRFLAAEWANGDLYKLVVKGITVTIEGDTGYVIPYTWSSVISEYQNIETKIDNIQTDTTAIIADITAAVDEPPTAKSLHDTLHKDGSYTYDNTTDSLEAISDKVTTVDTVVDAIQTDVGDPSGRTNLQNLEDMMGNPDTAGKTLYEAIKNIRETAINGSSLPIANTISDILHKDGSYTYDNTTDSLEAISDAVSAAAGDVTEIPSETNAKTFNATALASIEAEATDALEAEHLDHFLQLDGATQKYPENCETDSILAKILVKADPAVPSQYDNSTDSLEAIRDNIDTLNAADQVDLDAIIVGTITNATGADVATDVVAVKGVVDSIETKVDTVDTVVDGIQTDLDNATDGLGALKTLIDANKTVIDTIDDFVDGTTTTPTAYRREYGVTQIKEVSITAAANAGVTTVATITTQPCLIKSVVIHADAAQTGDMTTCGLYGGTNQVVEFLGVADATQANLNAADMQVSWTGAVRFAASDTIAIDLQGTGATAVDLTIIIEYISCVDGGYLA